MLLNFSPPPQIYKNTLGLGEIQIGLRLELGACNKPLGEASLLGSQGSGGPYLYFKDTPELTRTPGLTVQANADPLPGSKTKMIVPTSPSEKTWCDEELGSLQ